MFTQYFNTHIKMSRNKLLFLVNNEKEAIHKQHLYSILRVFWFRRFSIKNLGSSSYSKEHLHHLLCSRTISTAHFSVFEYFPGMLYKNHEDFF